MSGLPDLPRVLGTIHGEADGPTLVCIGGLHGNEPAGVHALRRVVARLEADPTGIKGSFHALAGNRQALAVDRRFLAHDLNRAWVPSRVERVRAADGPLVAEDREVQEIDEALQRIVDEARGEVFVLDVHSTSGGGLPFVTLDDTLANRRFGFQIPAPHVLGLEEELAGTLLSHMIAQGVTAVGFECGQHADPQSVRRGEAAVWIALEAAGLLPHGARVEVAEARRLLLADTHDVPSVFEVRYRHPVTPEDAFRMEPGWHSFEPILRGTVLAHDNGTPIVAPLRGHMLMPLYQEQGEDGFFVIRRVRRAWLRLSAALRHVGARRIVHWLPGVRRHPDLAGVFFVNRRVARFYAREIFHLLGYRRIDETDDTLTMAPRDLPHKRVARVAGPEAFQPGERQPV